MMVRIATTLWIVWAIVVWNVVFDHVIVVEPALIVEEGGDSGLRELYVALTRPTKTLIVVHARRLPGELSVTG